MPGSSMSLAASSSVLDASRTWSLVHFQMRDRMLTQTVDPLWRITTPGPTHLSKALFGALAAIRSQTPLTLGVNDPALFFHSPESMRLRNSSVGVQHLPEHRCATDCRQ